MDDLQTEEEINEWTERSRKEGLCGMSIASTTQPNSAKNAQIITA
jgi:hypothetical protein